MSAQKNSNRIEFQRINDQDIGLYEFVKKAWHVIESSKKFVDGKHIKAICDHLEALSQGKITRLIVNMPPRFAKSSIISVLFRVWCWIKKPWLRFLCASYALSLAVRDNLKCRRLIQSQWFQDKFGHIFKLSKSQNAKIKFENDQSGSSQAVSTGSSATGEGFDIGIIDDPHSIDDKRSDVTREGTLEWFKDTWCTRLNDPLTSAMIVVGQRVHDQDLSGYILSGETGEHWVHLNLAAEFELANKCITHHNDGTFLWEDWRKLEGELLWEDRFPREVIERAKRRHGPTGFSALFQQSPVPSGGGQFKREWFRYFSETNVAYLLETSTGTRSVLKSTCWQFCTVDLAISSKQTADYTVFAVWVVTPERDLILIDLIRVRIGNPDQLKQLRLLHQQYPQAYFKIERVGYQLALIQQALADGIPCKEYNPAGNGDKVARASTPAIWMENGKMYFRKNAAYLQVLEPELLTFPKAPHDDMVDVCSMAADEVCAPHGPMIWSPDADDTSERSPERAPATGKVPSIFENGTIEDEEEMIEWPS